MLAENMQTTNANPLSDELLSQFAPTGVTFDEVRGHPSAITPRPVWQRLFGALELASPSELTRRWQLSQQLIRENGIVFGAYLDDDQQTRPWQLDPLPLLIENAEWMQIEAGLKQRATLLELLLNDLYGPQRLLHEGHLPPELLHLHPGPWRALHGWKPRGGKYLNLYAADMARAPNGQWWVLADRSEAPSGIGFALENRIVVSRMLPSEFRDCHVRRLAPFFQALKDTLHDLSPRTDNPRIAILTEGRASASYFEDAYLARYLGYTLVEASDLAVRNQQLWLKTLGGLLPIDVVMRRSETISSDPLELYPEMVDYDPVVTTQPRRLRHSSRGVVGLLQAARSGNVSLCNPLGSGLVESPILMAFMPKLCSLLLGEPLRLPGVATWWCGQPREREYVLNNIDDLYIAPAFRNRSHERRITRHLARLTRSELIDRIRANPAGFVAREKVERSTVPTWSKDQFTSSYLALRSYVVTNRDEYQVLSGGLARTSSSPDAFRSSVLSGEGSKDTWILADEPVPQPSLLPVATHRIELQRRGSDLPSRVAEDVFWLGRHLERTEFSARLLRAVALRLTSETDYRNQPEMPALLRALASAGQIDAGYVVDGIREQLPTIESSLPRFVADRSEQGSIRSLIETTLFTASKVRDRLSVDSWRILLNMEQNFRDLVFNPDLTSLLNRTNQLILDLSAFSGTVTESTTRTQAYRFLVIGRRLERALQIMTFVENSFQTNKDMPSELLEAVLEISDSLMTYRSRYMASLDLSAVLDLILVDESNPRSLAFQLTELEQLVQDLPSREVAPQMERHQRLTLSLINEIRLTDIEVISRQFADGNKEPLWQLMQEMSKQIPTLSNAITHRYFVHAEPSKQLTDITEINDQPLGDGFRMNGDDVKDPAR